MAITKEVSIAQVEVVGPYKHVQVKEKTVIKEDGVVISQSVQRHILDPSAMLQNVDSDGKHDGTYTHTDTDISGEAQETQDICGVAWTDAVKAAWKTFEESRDKQ